MITSGGVGVQRRDEMTLDVAVLLAIIPSTTFLRPHEKIDDDDDRSDG